MRRRSSLVGTAAAGVVLALGVVVGACGEDDAEPAATAGPTGAGTTAGTGDGDPGSTAVPADELDGRSFVSTGVAGYDLVADTTVQIDFVAGDLVAGAGCNSMSGTYSVDDGTLTVDQLAMTEMGCPPELASQDEWLGGLLTAGPTLTLSGDELVLDGGDAGTITLLDREVAEPDRPLEGTRWVVDGIVTGDAVSSVPDGVTAALTIEDGTAMVETGCNTGSGPVEIGPDTLTFGPLAITLRACEPGPTEVERAVLLTLVETVDAEIDGDRLSLRRDGEAGPVGLELVADG